MESKSHSRYIYIYIRSYSTKYILYYTLKIIIIYNNNNNNNIYTNLRCKIYAFGVNFSASRIETWPCTNRTAMFQIRSTAS